MGKLHCPAFTSGWGDMEIIESDDGKFMIIDTFTYGNAGPRKYVKKLLNGRKAKLLISHAHKDHNGDYEYYIKNDMIDEVYVSMYEPNQESSKDRDRQDKMIALAKKKKCKIYHVTKGRTIEIGKGATIKCIYARKTGSNNAKSLIMMATINGVKILLNGDAEKVTYNEMIAAGIDPKCNILKFSHHGVTENNPSSFIKKCGAEYAFCNCSGESGSSFRSWAEKAYSVHEAAGINCYSVLYNKGLVFDCRAGEVNVLCGGNYKAVINKVQGDGFTVAKQFHICNKEQIRMKPTMRYVDLQLAKDCICGAHGNGQVRSDFLGEKVRTVQPLINFLINEYRDRMIALEGGVGDDSRREWLKKCGFIYDPEAARDVIQKAVNKKLLGT